MIANLNTEQSAALAHLLAEHPSPLTIEGGPGGVRYVSLRVDGDWVRYEIAIDGEIQGAVPS